MVYLADILYEALIGPCFWELSNWKNLVAELGHSDLLPVYESNFAEMPISLLLKIAKNIKQTYFMNYQMDFDQICVKLMLSLHS